RTEGCLLVPLGHGTGVLVTGGEGTHRARLTYLGRPCRDEEALLSDRVNEIRRLHGRRPAIFPAANAPDPNPHRAERRPIPARGRRTWLPPGRPPPPGRNTRQLSKIPARANASALRRSLKRTSAAPPSNQTIA